MGVMPFVGRSIQVSSHFFNMFTLKSKCVARTSAASKHAEVLLHVLGVGELGDRTLDLFPITTKEKEKEVRKRPDHTGEKDKRRGLAGT
jgi:hypothetical protein